MSTKSPFRHFDGMCWPAPGERLGEISWSLRYADFAALSSDETKQAQLVAASVIDAYQELIHLPAKRRDAIIRELRKGPALSSETKAAS